VGSGGSAFAMNTLTPAHQRLHLFHVQQGWGSVQNLTFSKEVLPRQAGFLTGNEDSSLVSLCLWFRKKGVCVCEL
jgi:hypothetical protein